MLVTPYVTGLSIELITNVNTERDGEEPHWQWTKQKSLANSDVNLAKIRL